MRKTTVQTTDQTTDQTTVRAGDENTDAPATGEAATLTRRGALSALAGAATGGLLLAGTLPFGADALAAPVLQSGTTGAREESPARREGVPARRRALLVAINTYRREGEAGPWANLHCDEDARAMKAVLIARYGFKEDDVLVVADGVAKGEGKNVWNDTSRAGIVKAFREWLIAGAKPGDILYFGYSGHGGIEYDPDGEPLASLVPSDWKVAGSDRERHVTQKDLTALVQDLKDRMTVTTGAEKKVVGTLLMAFDCCHSGDIVSDVRGAVSVRGRDPKFPLKKPANAKEPRRDATRGPAQGDSAVGTPALKERGFVALLACRHYQPACEVEPYTPAGRPRRKAMGRLTYVLADLMGRPDAPATYRELYERVRQRFAAEFPDQDPEVEGTPDYLLFSGVAEGAAGYVPVLALPDGVYLDAGRVRGVTVGSRYALYRAGTTDFAKSAPLLSATVETADATRARLKFDQPPTPGEKASLGAARAVETAHAFPDDALTVDASALAALTAPTDGRAALELLVKKAGRTSLFEILSGDSRKAAKVVLARPGDCPRQRGPEANDPDANALLVPLLAPGLAPLLGIASEDTPDALAERTYRTLKEIARCEFLRGLYHNEPTAKELQDPNPRRDGIALQLRMVPVQIENQRVVGAIPTGPLPLRENWKLRETFVLQVRNAGTLRAYVTLFDLQPTGLVNPLWPLNASDTGIRRWVDAGAGWTTLTRADAPWWLVIEPPFGKEQIKLVATKTEVDYGELITGTRGALTSRGTDALQNPLGRLLGETQEGKRVGTQPLPNDEPWGTATATFTVLRGGVGT
jgi:hypothetical protein